MTAPLPVVLVPACNRQIGQHAFHVAGKKYVDFVRLAGCLPLVFDLTLELREPSQGCQPGG